MIEQRLDLTQFLEQFSSFFAREKAFFIEGDQNLHFEFIKTLDTYEFKGPKKVKNLDSVLMHIKKQGVLRLEDIFEFVKIIRYFKYLRSLPFEGVLSKWLEKIVIPENFKEIEPFFDEEGVFKEDLDENLQSISTALRHNKENISSSLRKLLNSQKLNHYLVDKQIHYINDTEALLLRGGFNKVIKGSIVSRSSGGHFYIAPESISSLKERNKQLVLQKEGILYEYAKRFSAELKKIELFLKFINKEFDRFDHYQARIFFARAKNLEFIKSSKDDKIILTSFAHPAISKPKKVTVDFSKNVLMITGVNAGGKTMLLKSILSAAYMAKYLIPMNIDANKSHIGRFKDILAIIDDPQNVQNDISTFAGRMLEFSKLLTKREVIVGVDEIELGTDSDEAAALFKVLIEDLIKKRVKVVITTHHKRLASLLADNDEVSLMAALYDEANREPTYEFLQGIIGKSYAFETASRYGIPVNLVQDAKKTYGEDQEKLNELIEKSSELERSLRAKHKEVDERLEGIKRKEEHLESSKEEFFNSIKNKKGEMELLYKNAIDEAKLAIKAKSSNEAHKHLTNANKALPKKEVKKEAPKEPIKEGDNVKYRSGRGVVLSIRGKQAHIEVEGIKLRVALDELKKVKKIQTSSKKANKINVSKLSVTNGDIKLDLHGMRSDEAIEKLDEFLSNALILGLDEVVVFHGIGTGKLAYAVNEYLKRHPKVIKFHDTPANQGGYGAKVVVL